MNQQHLVIAGGAFALLAFLMKSDPTTATSSPSTTPKGLTITEAEALGLIMANKLAYPSLLSSLPESVVMATIAMESNFDPNAVAPAGERGLMQVIYPGTWNDVLKRARLSDELDPFEAKDNILVGMAYLRLIKNELGNAGALDGTATDWVKIDQAYNIGPAAFLRGRSNQPRIGKFLLAREKFQRAGLP